MKRATLSATFALFALCASTAAMAQDDAGPPALDLSVPAERIQFASVGADADADADADHRNEPPGAWRPITPEEAARKVDNDWQVHGAVEAGVG